MTKEKFFDELNNLDLDYKNTREKLNIRVYKERPVDGNPYYSSNTILNACLKAVDEIMDSGEKEINNKDQEILDKIDENSSLYNNFKYLASHNIYEIERMAGGHRSKIENDTEIDISILLLDEVNKEDFIENIENICNRLDVNWKRI